MTSYQKLKSENSKLINDVYKILDGDEKTRSIYLLKRQLNEAAMFGNLDVSDNNYFTGIFPKINHANYIYDKKMGNSFNDLLAEAISSHNANKKH